MEQATVNETPMSPEMLQAMKPKDFLSGDTFLNQLAFNDQGSAQWYKEKYPMFPDEYYQILELYSLGGVRFKEFRNLLKRLEKKGKIKRPDKVSIELAFQKINLSSDTNTELYVLPTNTVPPPTETNILEQHTCP